MQRLDVAGVGSEFGLSLIFSELADSMGGIYNNVSSDVNFFVSLLQLALDRVQNHGHEIRHSVPKQHLSPSLNGHRRSVVTLGGHLGGRSTVAQKSGAKSLD